MDVNIKRFDVLPIEVKTKGIEFEIRKPGKEGKKGDFLGDLVLTKKYLIWCKGQTTPENGVKLSLLDFIKYMETRQA